MNIPKYLCLTIVGLVLIVLMSGCPLLKNYGKIRLQEKMTIQRLVERWQDYDVYYAGVHKQFASAVLFDPKDDERKLLTHDWWDQVNDQKELSEIIKWIKVGESLPQLRKILGPDNQFYGYIYTELDYAHIKVIDGKTLWVDDIPMPSINVGPQIAPL